ncbi:DNA-directed RNA polymerase I subunit RPA34 [Salarias fasciatus]|uniref:CD3e molecule, epsilon associated protein n=1 Tax=Salarias fasciatus TaxID=181472 RepID=A0A672GL44_SALFA|nr:DNA-directed RNA polymerase I subunit RPA34 [Salarias fasciatus]
MPKDVSSSSSEDEADSCSPPPEKKNRKYQCPADFVTFCHEPCSSTLTDSLKDKNTELWLIKAPLSFKPERFGGLKVPLAGLQTLKVPDAAAGGVQQIYSILASDRCPSELRLLTAGQTPADEMVFSPAFSGQLNVCESYGDSSANQAPRVIPAAPAPAIPPGLKQRFHPFGSRTPTLTCVAENEVDGAALGPSSATLRPLVVKRFMEDAEEEEESRTKKKKKKEKRVKTEHDEEAPRVKQEPGAALPEDMLNLLMGDDFLEDQQSEEKRKKKKKKEKQVKTEYEEEPLTVKQEPAAAPPEDMLNLLMGDDFLEDQQSEEKRKKKKRDREREEVEEGLEPSASVKLEQVVVKSEPVDSWYSEAAEASAKKKKKKKKSKVEED